MSRITFRDLSPHHDFGTRVSGIEFDDLADRAIRDELEQRFEARGLLVFKDIEPSAEMQVTLSEVFGPLQPHAFKNVPTAGKDKPGVVNFDARPEDPDYAIVNGERLASWVPWHFDACYTKRLNRAGLLRPIVIPPSGGFTGFADGVQIYRDISPTLRDAIERHDILYHPWLMFENLRFGRPAELEIGRTKPSKRAMIDGMKDEPRALHPAVWQRRSGEKVLHVSPWQADGIAGFETPEGDALLSDLVAEMNAKMNPYFHEWRPRDMVLWDNWRFLHSCTGHDPNLARHMHRTTIQGDYGLGRFENNADGKELAEAMI